MKFAAGGFFAMLVLAPFAAGAAQPPARFAATLQGTIVDELEYVQTTVTEDCRSGRAGHGGRRLEVRSLRPTAIVVRRGKGGPVYRPPRLIGLRVVATTLAGGFSELRSCRFLPPEKLTGRCGRSSGAVRRLNAEFRRGRNAVRFQPLGATEAATACGLDRTIPAGWLDVVAGRIDEKALMSGRARRVLARASTIRRRSIGDGPALDVKQRTTVRWTLTFRRVR